MRFVRTAFLSALTFIPTGLTAMVGVWAFSVLTGEHMTTWASLKGVIQVCGAFTGYALILFLLRNEQRIVPLTKQRSFFAGLLAPVANAMIMTAFWAEPHRQWWDHFRVCAIGGVLLGFVLHFPWWEHFFHERNEITEGDEVIVKRVYSMLDHAHAGATVCVEPDEHSGVSARSESAR